MNDDNRNTLLGNVFITIEAGTVVRTDDPKFPWAILGEDVKVCSNAKAKALLIPSPEKLGSDL